MSATAQTDRQRVVLQLSLSAVVLSTNQCSFRA